MLHNKHLHKAARVKDDDFYTSYKDIAKELSLHDLKGKRVYCPCDDYRMSNFVRFLGINFKRLGLKSLTATCYDIGAGAWKYYTEGEERHIEPLKGDGDFRGEECTAILRVNDVVITNPPFSLTREFIPWVLDHGKDIIIIGFHNTSTYKDIVPYFVSGRLYVGLVKAGSASFTRPGDKKGKAVPVSWYQSLRKPTRLWIDTGVKYDPRRHPFYDDGSAIECKSIHEIPMDYPGVMGAPINTMNELNLDQFRFLGTADPTLNGRKLFKRILIQKI